MAPTLNAGDREILDSFIRTRDKTIDLLDRIPDDMLSRCADGEDHATAWVLGHIASGVTWWMDRVMRDGGGVLRSEATLTRDQLKSRLIETRDRLIGFFGGGPAAMDASYDYPRPQGGTRPLTGRWCVQYLIEHEVHHRGKIVLALRQWGFNDIPFMPYSGWD